MSNAVYWVYMTAGDMDEARRIGRHLVNGQLAACVNILEGMTAIFRWDGEAREDREVVVIAKTTEERRQAFIATVKAVHSYDCPCILFFPVAGGNPDFLAWIAEEVAPRPA